MSKKKVIGSICIAWVALTLFSMLLFNTANWLGVGYGHIVLAVTDKNQCQIGRETYVAKDFYVMLEALEKEGWVIAEPLEQYEQGYVLHKDDSTCRHIALKKHAITGYDVVMLSKEMAHITLCFRNGVYQDDCNYINNEAG